MELLAQANFIASAKQGGRPGQCGQSGGGGNSGWKPAKEVDKKKSTKDSGRGGGGRRRECWLCGDPDQLSFECPDHNDSDDDEAKEGRGRSGSRRPCRGGNKPRKEKQLATSTSTKEADSLAGGKARDDKTASCSLVGVMEPTVSLALEAGEDFQAVAAAVQANPAVVLLDSGCSHHLIGTKEVFVDLQPSGSIKHMRGFNGALQNVQGRGTVALQGEAGKQVLIPNVLYVLGVRANLLSFGQLKEHGVKLQEDRDEMLLDSAAGELLKDRKTRYVSVRLVAKKSDVLLEFQKWLVLVERQVKKLVLMLRSNRGGEFLGKKITDFVDGKGIVHDLTCP
ncbi:unnamed protein product [Closterium sp. NIES-64]|nr:unnamed protein product [Closterium sp. NIES-64]